ncbi:unnamed protein product [Dibothriocephalus latus]|uniref:Uncharacterized protein n=1 Tax=Dibothriocephalus latus TaxID=60516 RepID=A0A3P7LQX5_DIBLA|nr:unnamed protein product [Dibothriocephalus latus]
MVRDAAGLKPLLAKVSRTLGQLKKEKVITIEDWYMAKRTEAAMAQFYDFPKVHKPDVLLWPVVSLPFTPT